MYAIYDRFFRTRMSRILLSLVLALTFVPWSTGAPLAVHAAAAPKYRVQVIVKSAHFYDDHDWHGAGDIRMFAHLYLCPANTNMPCVPGEPGVKPLTYHEYKFDGYTGMTSGLNRVLPFATDHTWSGYDLSDGAGYPMYEGERYVLRFELADLDNGYGHEDDQMGFVDIWLDEATGYQLRAHAQDAAKGGGKRGDYRLDYEVRLTQLPNLVATSLEHYPVPGSSDSLVCVGVANAGAEPSGSFPVTLKIDGQVARDGAMNGGSLGPGQFGQVCTQTRLPAPTARHEWAAFVDQAGIVPEMNEYDNAFTAVLFPGPGAGPAPVSNSVPPASPSPTPAPATGQAGADLAVSAIKVNGQAPDGKDDCKDGKSDVTAVVKNDGAANAQGFAVRLTVDGVQVGVKSVAQLDAGDEHEVRFEDVRLKKGEHKLAATTDLKGSGADSKPESDWVKVTVRCQDGG